MGYDFTSIIPRKQTSSVKWDVGENELPMWIADMDFKTSPKIIAAMKQKVDTGVFGYEEIPAEYYQAIIAWYATEHQTIIKRQWLLYVTGVIPALSSIVRSITNVGDNILVQAPVYNMFFHSIENNGRHVLSSDLNYSNGSYKINWQDLEQKLAQPLTTMMILCNPHNPLGIAWSKNDLYRILELCATYHVKLVSDEIHADLAWGTVYTPLISLVNEQFNKVVSLVSPSKAFNLAALHAATVIVPNENLRNQINRGLNNDELAEPNILSVPGTIAAYTEGKPWLMALNKQLESNWNLIYDFLHKNLPQLKIASGKATYLMWLDASYLKMNSTQLAQLIRRSSGLILSPGEEYRGNGGQFLRLNYACPEKMLLDGLARLYESLSVIYKKNNE